MDNWERRKVKMFWPIAYLIKCYTLQVFNYLYKKHFLLKGKKRSLREIKKKKNGELIEKVNLREKKGKKSFDF